MLILESAPLILTQLPGSDPATLQPKIADFGLSALVNHKLTRAVAPPTPQKNANPSDQSRRPDAATPTSVGAATSEKVEEASLAARARKKSREQIANELAVTASPVIIIGAESPRSMSPKLFSPAESKPAADSLDARGNESPLEGTTNSEAAAARRTSERRTSLMMSQEWTRNAARRVSVLMLEPPPDELHLPGRPAIPDESSSPHPYPPYSGRSKSMSARVSIWQREGECQVCH